MIGITTLSYDPGGARIFPQAGNDGGSALHSLRRRTSRRATLDGGVSVYDTGMSHGDRDILVEEPNATHDAIAYATRIIESYSQVVVCTSEGAFIGTPESIRVDDDGTLLMTVWVIDKISL